MRSLPPLYPRRPHPDGIHPIIQDHLILPAATTASGSNPAFSPQAQYFPRFPAPTKGVNRKYCVKLNSCHQAYISRCFLVTTYIPDTLYVANIVILNMACFGTEMACFRLMLNSDISLITLFTIYYNATKNQREIICCRELQSFS